MNGAPMDMGMGMVMGIGIPIPIGNDSMPGIIIGKLGIPPRGIIGSMPGMPMFNIGAGRGRSIFLLLMAMRVAPGHLCYNSAESSSRACQ